MDMLKIAAAASTVLVLAACSSTGTQTSSASSAQANQVASTSNGADDKDGVICERVQATGTRFTEKRCSTAAQRKARARAARDAAAQVGIKAQQAGGPQGG